MVISSAAVTAVGTAGTTNGAGLGEVPLVAREVVGAAPIGCPPPVPGCPWGTGRGAPSVPVPDGLSLGTASPVWGWMVRVMPITPSCQS
ncbi:hypothetical protein GCM10009660_41800 [Catellatospora bangladeshensis]